MPKKLIKRFMPSHDRIKQQKALKIFGSVLYNPNLWCLNRRSAAGAFAVGLFIAFVPLPSQMIMAAGVAILCGVNLPLSVALVWISNPITMPVLFYFAYRVGAWLLHCPEQDFHFELSRIFFLIKSVQLVLPCYSAVSYVELCSLLLVTSVLMAYGAIQWFVVGKTPV